IRTCFFSGSTGGSLAEIAAASGHAAASIRRATEQLDVRFRVWRRTAPLSNVGAFLGEPYLGQVAFDELRFRQAQRTRPGQENPPRHGRRDHGEPRVSLLDAAGDEVVCEQRRAQIREVLEHDGRPPGWSLLTAEP